MTNKTSSHQFVFSFGPGWADGNASMKELLGGKGANLAEMCSLGLPVPPGFTISTEVCSEFLSEKGAFPDELAAQVDAALQRIRETVGERPDGAPTLLSVRSGGRVSMPGMMDTVLNLGLNDEAVVRLAQSTGDDRFAWDSYRRFIQMYADVVMGVGHDYFEEILDDYKLDHALTNDADLEADDWKAVIVLYRACIADYCDTPFPETLSDQLWGAIRAVFNSWNNVRAETYRKLHDIPSAWGTAVTVQAMVFGNLGDRSATGVCFTRNPSTGERALYGEFLPNAQGEDVVAGIRTPYYISEAARQAVGDHNPSLESYMPENYQQLVDLCDRLEAHFKDMQDIEFTIQEERLYILQTRSGKRVTQAALKIAVDLVAEGVLSKDEALLRIDPNSLDQLLHPTLDANAHIHVLTKGLPASPGAASGHIVFTANEAEAAKANGQNIILVRMETSPEDIHGMYAANGILTSRGGMTSHAAVVARGLGRACVSGASGVRIDFDAQTAQIGDRVFKSGDVITIDGSTGRVMDGEVQTKEPELTGDFATLIGWADERRQLGVRANAETTRDAEMALKFGADGIGLCRTEHMFFDPLRIDLMRQMIITDDRAVRQEKLNALRVFQVSDFVDLFNIMDGLPITIRLLDPPLHEFLPKAQEDSTRLAQELNMPLPELKARMQVLHETNPMLGHRGCRLGITMPEIYEMQLDAIFEAIKSNGKAEAQRIEIMVPFIISVAELKSLRALFEQRKNAWIAESGSMPNILFGTMIETPRSALIAGQLAPFIDFISFGSNDLTQMTMAISRDDAASFLPNYVAKGLLVSDPFMHLDEEGVGALIQIAVKGVQESGCDVKIGLCGEHGGDPNSIRFLNEIGLNYVSCSPYRLPIARLSAAQARILTKK